MNIERAVTKWMGNNTVIKQNNNGTPHTFISNTNEDAQEEANFRVHYLWRDRCRRWWNGTSKAIDSSIKIQKPHKVKSIADKYPARIYSLHRDRFAVVHHFTTPRCVLDGTGTRHTWIINALFGTTSCICIDFYSSKLENALHLWCMPQNGPSDNPPSTHRPSNGDFTRYIIPKKNRMTKINGRERSRNTWKARRRRLLVLLLFCLVIGILCFTNWGPSGSSTCSTRIGNSTHK